MTAKEARAYWEGNAAPWTRLVRAGWDVYRDVLNTPAFLSMLPEVNGLRGLDIGCGEGHNTRLLAGRGASMTALDVSSTFARAAAEAGAATVVVADGAVLPFASSTFDFATAFMSLMDMPHADSAIGEAFRVLAPGGFLQFSICHPCFSPPQRRLIRDEQGRPRAVELGCYFNRTNGEMIERWGFSAAPKEEREMFHVPVFHRPLSDWLNDLTGAGFLIERVQEPYADEELAARVPHVADTRVVGYFLHVRARKPA